MSKSYSTFIRLGIIALFDDSVSKTLWFCDFYQRNENSDVILESYEFDFIDTTALQPTNNDLPALVLTYFCIFTIFTKHDSFQT